MNQQTLSQENGRFEGTAGVSQNNRSAGFTPAFQDRATGRVELARLATGSVATMHVISWLPAAWAKAFDADGKIIELKDDVVCGFVRDGEFFTREQAAQLLQ